MKKETKNNLYNFKALALDIKDIDESNRKVKMYLSSFGTIDSDRDRISQGAYAKSITERGPSSASNRKIAFLRMHDWNKQVGIFTELTEDSFGLLAVAQLGRSTIGQDTLLDYQDKIIREHSIGFRYIADKMTYDEANNVYDIKEVELWEGSAVTFGANENTPVIDVSKGLTKESYLKELNEQMNSLTDALRNGKGSDDRLYSIEMGLKVVQSKYNHLVTYQPTDVKLCTGCRPTPEPDTEKTTLEENENKRKKVLIYLNS